MRILLLLVLLAGCSPSPRNANNERLAECFADAAYACVAGEREQAPEDPVKCCGKCGGTGRVLSGDRLALVPCDCDPACDCKKNNKGCTDGECKL